MHFEEYTNRKPKKGSDTKEPQNKFQSQIKNKLEIFGSLIKSEFPSIFEFFEKIYSRNLFVVKPLFTLI